MIVIAISILLFLSGWLYRIQTVQSFDIRAFYFLYHNLRKLFSVKLFQELWFLGKTPFVLIFLLLLFSIHIQKGLIAAVVFLAAVALERVIKVSLSRPRPFQNLQDVNMDQPTRPTDPSFPSGDSLRVWFLAVLLLNLLPATGITQAALLLLASSVTLGRIVMGVHYPSDTITGAGMGVFAGQCVLWAWDLIPLFPVG